MIRKYRFHSEIPIFHRHISGTACKQQGLRASLWGIYNHPPVHLLLWSDTGFCRKGSVRVRRVLQVGILLQTSIQYSTRRCYREAAFRCSQAGHIILSAIKDEKVDPIEWTKKDCKKEYNRLWREELFMKLLVTQDQKAKINSSFFINCVNITVTLPEVGDVIKYGEIAELVYPDSLHHLVWMICLNQKLEMFKYTVFHGLMYSVEDLNNCAAESLNMLDIQSFLYCTALTVQQQLEETKQQINYNVDKPSVLPAVVMDQLGTVAQIKWLTAAYKMYRNDYVADMSELQLNLIQGIKVVRCVDDHGLDVKQLVILANTFAERAKSLTKQSEIEFNEARADLYWKAALPLLEKLQKNQVVTYPPNRLFEYKSKEMNPAEIQSNIDEGKLFNGTLLMKRKEYEKALHIFKSLRSPYAMFHQAQIYESMADEQVNQNKENVTSEMRSQHRILLSRARRYLCLTLDRLRDPSFDRKHPLNAQVGTEMEKIERLLSRTDPDVHNLRNECDGMSDKNVPSTSGLPQAGALPFASPDEVAINTGEENEAMLFAKSAKLLSFINKEWQERGVGTLKILQSKETGKVRILMRRDQVHKICANHFLSKDMTLTPMPNRPRAYMWIANDYADEKIVLVKLCARFKTEEEAGAFYNAFEKAKSSLVEHSDSSSSASSLVRDDGGECNVVKTTETTSLGGFTFTSNPTFKPKEQDLVPKVTVQPEGRHIPGGVLYRSLQENADLQYAPDPDTSLPAEPGIAPQQQMDRRCPICGDEISGFHYGICSCESCKCFFKRAIQNEKNYVCSSGAPCTVTVETRKNCSACRFNKCLKCGMKREAVRGDRSRGGRSTY